MRALRPSLSAAAVLAVLAASGSALATGGDTWPTLSHDGYRSARSTGKGAIAAAPSVAWKLPVGGALDDGQIAVADVDGDGKEEAVVVSAGRVVARRSDDSTVWKSANIGALRVAGVWELDGVAPAEVVAIGSSPQGLYILNAATGATIWALPTVTAAIDALAVPAGGGKQRLFLSTQLAPLDAYDFTGGIQSPAANHLWSSATSPWSVDFVAADVDGDGQMDLVRGQDRGFTVYDAKTGAVKCDASNLIAGTLAPSYFPALSKADVDGDGRDEIVVYDYSYYYSEDAGVFVVTCTGAGAVLTAQTLWSQQWITDVTPGPGNDVDAKQIRYLADGVADLDGQKPLEIAYSLWDASSASWTTFVRNAATGALVGLLPGQAIEAVGDVDNDGKAEILVRDATGIGALPKPFFSTLKAYDLTNGMLTDKGWALKDARVATVSGKRTALVTAGAGAVAARQNVDGGADPAEEVYVFQQHQGQSSTDLRPGKLLAVHGTDGGILRKYDFPPDISGAVLALSPSLTAPGAPAQSLVMLNDGGLRVLDTLFAEAGKILPGNHARFVTVASLDGAHNLILGVDSSDALVAIDGTVVGNGTPSTAWRYPSAAQTEARGYVSAPGLVVPAPGGGATLIARGHSAASFEEQALVGLNADGSLAWKTDIGAGRQIPGFENFELLDDLDGDGVPDFFLTELDAASEQQLVVRRGKDASLMVARPVGDLFPPSGVYLQGHAAADVNGDGKLDVVSALHGSWFVGIDVSQAAGQNPQTGFQQIFRTSNGPNGQAMVGQLDSDPALDLVRTASQNAFGTYEVRDLQGNVVVSYQPPTPGVAGADANTAALLARPGSPGESDLVWAGMAGAALGAVARLDGQTLNEVWFDYLAGGKVYAKGAQPAALAALYPPITADIDGDGADEVLVGADDGFLYALRGTDGSALFAVDLGAPVVHVIAADLDLDPDLELLAALSDGTLVALDAQGSYVAGMPPMPDGGVDGGGGAGGGTSMASATGSGTGSGGHGGAPATSSDSSTSAVDGASSSGSTGAGGGSAGEKGGCGCRAAGSDGGSAAGAIAALGLAAALAGRRRRHSGRSC
jgi:MYXO-CTERM domain-containing protein